MKRINNELTRTFVDENGDSLITLTGVKKRDYDFREKLIVDMVKINVNTKNPTIDDIQYDHGKINEFMFTSVAKKLIINGEEITEDKLLETYKELDI